MPDLDFEDVDTVKAFFTLLLGSALAAVLLYVYFKTIRPSLQGALGVSTPAPVTSGTVVQGG